jgi:hypothetical protein
MASTAQYTQTAILSRAFQVDNGNLSPDLANFILAVELSDEDQHRLRELADLARGGVLDEQQETELENYRHVGRLLELLKSKARISLKGMDRHS